MILEFAQKYGLDIWDWIAVIISFFSLLVACVSVFVATKTLVSQKKTEKNTLPVLTREKQLATFKLLAMQLISSYFKALRIRLILNELKNDEVLSEINMADLILDSSGIHLELFYNTEVEDGVISDEFDSPYVILSNLKQKIDEYNNVCLLLGKHLMSQNIDNETKKEEFDTFIIGELHFFLMYFILYLEKIFNCKEGFQDVYIYSIINSGSEYYFDESLKAETEYLKNLDELIDNDMWTLMFHDYNIKRFGDVNLEEIPNYIKYYVIGKIKFSNDIIKFTPI